MPILLDTSEGLAHWVWQTYGVRPDRMRCIARLSCEIHRIGRAEHAAEDLSLRIYPRGAGGTADIEAEMAWLAGLGDAGCRVPTPRAGVDGRLVQCRPDGRAAVLLSWVSGRILDAGLRPLHLRRVGRLVGMMHRVAADLTAAHRLASTRQADGPDLDSWAEGRRPRTPHLPAPVHQRVERAAERLRGELACLSRAPSGWGFVHGDLHLWNLLFQAREAGAIDFSDCGWGPQALDLAAPLQYLKFPLAGHRDHSGLFQHFRDELFEGYAECRPLPPDVGAQVQACLELRAINTIEWILDCWPRIDARPWGPAFLARAGDFFDAD